METLKPLRIVDDRRCALCGEFYSECDCFDQDAARPGASEPGPEKAQPTELHGPFDGVCTCHTVWDISFPCSVHSARVRPAEEAQETQSTTKKDV